MTEKARVAAQQIIEQDAARSPMPVDEVVWRECGARHCLELLGVLQGEPPPLRRAGLPRRAHPAHPTSALPAHPPLWIVLLAHQGSLVAYAICGGAGAGGVAAHPSGTRGRVRRRSNLSLAARPSRRQRTPPGLGTAARARLRGRSVGLSPLWRRDEGDRRDSGS